MKDFQSKRSPSPSLEPPPPPLEWLSLRPAPAGFCFCLFRPLKGHGRGAGLRAEVGEERARRGSLIARRMGPLSLFIARPISLFALLRLFHSLFLPLLFRLLFLFLFLFLFPRSPRSASSSLTTRTASSCATSRAPSARATS